MGGLDLSIKRSLVYYWSMRKSDCKARCAEIETLIKQYKGKYKDLRSEFDKRIVSDKFAKGGIDMHRGYYCPSLILDLYCNVNRGALCKQDSKLRIYRYCFDNEGRMILVERKHPSGVEFIMHGENSEIGIQYDNNKRVRVVTECEFYPNGRIKTYERFECEPRGVVRSYDREGYEYFEDSMIVECTDYFVYQDIQTMRHDIMHFTIEDGYLTQYINKSYVDGELMDTPANDWVWKVYIKRKVP